MTLASSTMELASVDPSKPLSVPEPWWLVIVAVYILCWAYLVTRRKRE
jgi:hypothetical protein